MTSDFSRPAHSATTRCVAVSLRPDKMGRSVLATEACTLHVRTLQLRNQSIRFYSHASLVSLCWLWRLWTSGHPALAETLAPWLLRISRWYCAQTHAVTLWQHIAWRALHVGWSSHAPNTMLWSISLFSGHSWVRKLGPVGGSPDNTLMAPALCLTKTTPGHCFCQRRC